MSTPIDFEALFQASPNPYMLVDRGLRYVAANDAYVRVTATKREELIGRNLFELFPHDPQNPANVQARRLRQSLEKVLATRAPDVLALIPYRVPKRTDGGVVLEERFWSATHTPILDGAGEVAFILQHTVDVTELERLRQSSAEDDTTIAAAGVLHRAEQVQAANTSLSEERNHLRRLFEQAPSFMAVLAGPEHTFELANASYLKLVGHRDLVGKPVRDALPELAGQGFYELLDRVYQTGEPFLGRGIEVFLQQQRGSPPEPFRLDFVYQPLFDGSGRVSGIFVQGHDITAQATAEKELRRYRDHLEELVKERTLQLQQSEAALRQALKMEAVGKLTGGVAHDFNNLLQVIAGNLQLLQRDPGIHEQAQRRLRTAVSAVDRGARLASHLLAFARRQPLEPVPVNLGRLVHSLDELLRRTLGENVLIETSVPGKAWNTFADVNGIENMILNLAINARDAMRGEGKLTLEVCNAGITEEETRGVPDLKPGDYVRLSVTDTGCGMSAEVLEHAFEPFFTTKPEGQGTGLGLSMVYGFVKQSGGHVLVDSEVGKGTRFRIYLPRDDRKELSPVSEVGADVVGGDETILVVEDDREVRATVVELLTDLGYRVLQAQDGATALAVIDSGAQIDLLFTDVVMPGPIKSPELARRLKARRPAVEVLFTSGYAQDAIVHDGRLDPGVRLLAKPYKREELARKLRQLLGAAKSARADAPTASNGAGLRILLVEDDQDVRDTLEEMLQSLGHLPRAVASAEEALKLLAAHVFDVLFTDYTLPGRTGAELLREAARLHPGMGLILASGRSNLAELGVGSSDVQPILLNKPYDLLRMQSALAEAGPRSTHAR